MPRDEKGHQELPTRQRNNVLQITFEIRRPSLTKKKNVRYFSHLSFQNNKNNNNCELEVHIRRLNHSIKLGNLCLLVGREYLLTRISKRDSESGSGALGLAINRFLRKRVNSLILRGI